MRPYSADTSQAVPVRVRQLEIQQDGQHTRGVTAGTANAAYTLAAAADNTQNTMKGCSGAGKGSALGSACNPIAYVRRTTSYVRTGADGTCALARTRTRSHAASLHLGARARTRAHACEHSRCTHSPSPSLTLLQTAMRMRARAHTHTHTHTPLRQFLHSIARASKCSHSLTRSLARLLACSLARSITSLNIYSQDKTLSSLLKATPREWVLCSNQHIAAVFRRGGRAYYSSVPMVRRSFCCLLQGESFFQGA